MAEGEQVEVTTGNGNKRQCAAKNRRNKPCGGYAVEGSIYCFAHNPTQATERKAARSAGGKARHGRRVTWADQAAPISIRSVDDIVALLERAIVAEMSLENSHSRNATVGRLATAALKALEIGELEARLAALEAAYAQQDV